MSVVSATPATSTQPVIMHIVSASTPVKCLPLMVPADDAYLSEFHLELDTKLRTFTMRLGNTIKRKVDWAPGANLFNILRDCCSAA